MSSRFGSLIFQARIRKRISQKFVANTAGIDASYLASVERGRRPPPRKHIANKVLAALGVSPADQSIMLEAAALDRLMPAIQDVEQDIRGAATLASLCNALPHLNEAKLSVLSALIDTLADRQEEEGQMT